jgi:hypothetical protein
MIDLDDIAPDLGDHAAPDEGTRPAPVRRKPGDSVCGRRSLCRRRGAVARGNAQQERSGGQDQAGAEACLQGIALN